MQIFPVFIPQKGCPFLCVYCDQSSFGCVQETPFEVLTGQIREFCLKHKNTDKQIAFYGGTFTGLSTSERDKYYHLTKPFLDKKTSLRISTRPDMVGNAELEWCKAHHVKTIELGIQDFSDEVLKASQRGYNRQTALDACRRVKEFGFELGVQLMPGLPGYSVASSQISLRTLREVIVNLVRVYPTVILKGTLLWNMWEKGEVQPLTLEQAIDACVEICEWADSYNVQIIKLGIPSLEKGTEYAGPYHPAFGELVKGERLVRKIVAGFKPGMSILIPGDDISLLTGHKGYSLRKLMERTGQKTIKLVPDSFLSQGGVRFSNAD